MNTDVAIYRLDTDEHETLADGQRPWFASSGHVVFSRGSDLWAFPFDVQRLEKRLS